MTQSPRTLADLHRDVRTLSERIGHPTVAAQEVSLFQMTETIGKAVVGMGKRLDVGFTTLEASIRQVNLQITNLVADHARMETEDIDRVNNMRDEILKLKSAIVLVATRAGLDMDEFIADSGLTPVDSDMMEELEKMADS